MACSSRSPARLDERSIMFERAMVPFKKGTSPLSLRMVGEEFSVTEALRARSKQKIIRLIYGRCRVAHPKY